MHIAFDADGCLIDTKDVIRQSYREAGAEPPDDILACESTDWLLDQMTSDEAVACRDRKNVNYLGHLDVLARKLILPPYHVAVRLHKERYTVHLLSGAPSGTVQVLHRRLPSWPFGFALTNLRTPQKMGWLRQLTTPGVYVDDQDRFIDLPPGWRFIHYIGQDADTLYDQITTQADRS